jgi:hypothetical protein
VTAAFIRYEEALNANDVVVLNELFRTAPYMIRYGLAEELYGHDQIAGFRPARAPQAAHDRQYDHHLLWPRLCDRIDRIPPRRRTTARPPTAKLGPPCRRLAHRRRACELLRHLTRRD